jgi:hypothetical protein
LDSQAAVTRELNQLHDAAARNLPPGDAIATIGEFVRSSSCLDAGVSGRMRSLLEPLIAGFAAPKGTPEPPCKTLTTGERARPVEIRGEPLSKTVADNRR